jgi:hypothetical protein
MPTRLASIPRRIWTGCPAAEPLSRRAAHSHHRHIATSPHRSIASREADPLHVDCTVLVTVSLCAVEADFPIEFASDWPCSLLLSWSLHADINKPSSRNGAFTTSWFTTSHSLSPAITRHDPQCPAFARAASPSNVASAAAMPGPSRERLPCCETCGGTPSKSGTGYAFKNDDRSLRFGKGSRLRSGRSARL